MLSQVVNAMPVLLRIPWLTPKVLPRQRSFLALVDELLSEHKATWDRDQPPRDLTDAFLTEVHKVRGGCERRD